MQENCPKCPTGVVEYEDEQVRDVCACDDCGARFKVEEDGEYDDGWRDCSTPGEEITQDSSAEEPKGEA